MPHVYDDRILETTTTTGTGTLTLAGAVVGHKAMAAARRWDGTAIQANDTVPYAIWTVDGTGNLGADFEAGIGTYLSSASLARTTVLSSSNANAAVSFAAGTKYVAIGALARRILQLDPDGTLVLPAASAEPATPLAGSVALYARTIAPEYTVLKVKRPSGVDTPLQDSLSFNRLIKFSANGTAMVATGAAVLTASAAGTAVTPASGSAKAAVQRIQYASAATAGAIHTLISPSDSNAYVLRGGVAGEGGFRFVTRMALNALAAGNRGFWGVAATRTAATGAGVDPLTTAASARVGLAINANTGNMQLSRSDGTTAAAIDLGANFPVDTTSLYELLLVCRPHNGTSAGNISYRVRRYTTAQDNPAFETTGTLSTNIPAATTLLHPWVFFSNNATAAAVSWHFNSMTVEADW